MGPSTYALLKDLLAPALPSTKTFKVITETLQNHLDPIPNIIAERYRFYKREQMETESVSDYIAAIKKLSTKCDFKIFLNEALRDKLVCGLKDRTMQERLMSMKDLTFKHGKI